MMSEEKIEHHMGIIQIQSSLITHFQNDLNDIEQVLRNSTCDTDFLFKYMQELKARWAREQSSCQDINRTYEKVLKGE